MRNPLLAVVPLLFVASIARADIYKCTGDNGAEVYKNFPCNVESIGSSATATAPKEQPATLLSPTTPPRRQGSRVAAVEQPTATKREPYVGMPAAELKSSTWGEPTDIVAEEVVDGVNKTWVYNGSRKVVLGASGKVISVQR